MKKLLLLLNLLFLFSICSIAQDTYKIGKTEYYFNKKYSTTGKPMVKRSEANKAEFLNNKGYKKAPKGYEVDHIIPLSEGGTDDPSNMQLLEKHIHAKKSAREREKNTNSTYSSFPTYKSNSTYKPNKYRSTFTNNPNGKTIYTGKNGGKYYINGNGNKTYIKSSERTNPKKYSAPISTPKYYNSSRTIQTGPRGGKYYINSNGNKTYLKK